MIKFVNNDLNENYGEVMIVFEASMLFARAKGYKHEWNQLTSLVLLNILLISTVGVKGKIIKTEVNLERNLHTSRVQLIK